jgi:hypothetical protein
VEKESVQMIDAQGKEQPWLGGTGSDLVDSDRKLQYVYMIVRKDLSGTGATLRFRLRRGFGVQPADRSDDVSLPF